LALRQQLAVLKRRQPRPTLLPFDKLFWVLACRFWSDWKKSLLVVTPEVTAAIAQSYTSGGKPSVRPMNGRADLSLA